MLKKSQLTLLTTLTLMAGAVYAADKSAAMVNGVSIPQSRVDLRVDIVKSQGQPDTPELRKAVRAELIDLEVMSQEAGKMGLANNGDIVQQIELAKQSILAGAYMKEFTKKNPPKDAEVQAEYDKLKTMLGDKEYNARHILVKTDAEAKGIISQLDKGASFASLVNKSLDEGSKAQGGQLGWSVPNSFVSPFANALRGLQKGQYTKAPVQTEFGWHVILLEDTRAAKIPSLNEVKPQIQQRLIQIAVQKEIDRLQAKAKIE